VAHLERRRRSHRRQAGRRLTTSPEPNRASAFLNVRVADIKQVYKDCSPKGARFLSEPKDHGREIRAYLRDPDGHLIEVGQATGILR
jgi:catechol 2,3-dioxygenase-like lactoylglutathione lyase family enzyme